MADFDNILNKINSNIDTEMNLFNQELEAVLKVVQELTVIRAVENYSDPLQFDFAMQQVLQDAGYYDLVNSFINESYDKNYTEIIALFESGGLTATFSEADITSIKAIKQLDTAFFRGIGNQLSNSLKDELTRYSLSGIDVKTMTENIVNGLADTDLVRYSSTYADTAISNFNQSVIDLKANEVENEVYIYRGVKDSKTRSFCRCLLNQRKYYSKSDASKIKGDARRRFNCRHLTIPVSLEWAFKNGYAKGSFTC